MKKIVVLLCFIIVSVKIFSQHLTPPPLRTSAATNIPKKNYVPKIVTYHLYVRDTSVNFSGKTKRAIAVNGQIPMPTLTFTEGDTAEIFVHNELNEETALHWHGLMLPNRYDGVPNLTQMPIKPHSTFLYRFAIIQHGTHWYHSHSGLQEQIGMYGSMILNKPDEPTIPTIPVILSEWTDMNPNEVHRRLHNASDWFAIQKGTTQSYTEAIQKGYFKTKLANEWKRMNAMDVSDVYYDKFLINGKNETDLSQFKAGDKVRLRISNGGASSYFWLTYAGGKMTVVASDGNDVEPVDVDRLLIAVSETYDVIVTVPENNTAYQFLATPEDRTKSASLFIGNGIKKSSPPLPKLKYFEGMKMMNGMMKMNGDLDDMGMKMALNQMDMNVVMYPEITGEAKNTKDMKSDGMKMKDMKSDDMKMKDMKPNDMKMKDMKSDDMKMKDMKSDGKKLDNMKPDDMKMKDMKSDGKKLDDMKMKDMKSDSMKPNDMKMNDMPGMDANQYNSNTLSDIVTLNYSMLKSQTKTNLPMNAPVKEMKFELTGNMNRYVWSLDNKVVSEADKILIKKGENIRIILYNGSMMRHPMHLHGHDFRLLNGQGDYAPMKNIIDIMPMETDTIEFNANAEGDWFFHCHILYHMMSGMGRVFSYENSPANPEIPDPKLAQRKLFADDRRFHFMANVGLESNGTDGEAMFSNTRWKLGTLWHLGLHDEHGYESETMLGRYFGKMQWLYAYAGFDYHYKKVGGPENFIFGNEKNNLLGQVSNKNNRKTGVIGVTYTLPMLVAADFRVDGDGKFRFQLMREGIPVTNRLRMSLMINTDKEYMLGFKYIIAKNFALSTHYDSDMGLGAGITLIY